MAAVDAYWLTRHPAGLTFETVVVIIKDVRWVVVRRIAEGRRRQGRAVQ